MLLILLAVGSTEVNSSQLTIVIYAFTSFCTCILIVFFISLMINIYFCTRCKLVTNGATRSDHSHVSDPVQPIYDTISRQVETSEDQELNTTENVAYGRVQVTTTPL